MPFYCYILERIQYHSLLIYVIVFLVSAGNHSKSRVWQAPLKTKSFHVKRGKASYEQCVVSRTRHFSKVGIPNTTTSCPTNQFSPRNWVELRLLCIKLIEIHILKKCMVTYWNTFLKALLSRNNTSTELLLSENHSVRNTNLGYFQVWKY